MKNNKSFEIFFIILFCLILTISSKYENYAKINDNNGLISAVYSVPIVQLNKPDASSFLQIGDNTASIVNNQTLINQASDKPIMLAQNSTNTTYTVKSGDTLWDIASSYNITVKQIQDLNNLSSDALSLGENLIVSGQAQITQRSTQQQTLTPSRSGQISQSRAILQLAASYLYTPYKWGGTTPRGFDCSGFVQYVFGKFGYKLPRTAAEQATIGFRVDKANLMPGDLVFFDINGSGISHVGIYTGNGRFINASSPYDGGVIYSSLSEYSRAYVGAQRIVR